MLGIKYIQVSTFDYVHQERRQLLLIDYVSYIHSFTYIYIMIFLGHVILVKNLSVVEEDDTW